MLKKIAHFFFNSGHFTSVVVNSLVQSTHENTFFVFGNQASDPISKIFFFESTEKGVNMIIESSCEYDYFILHGLIQQNLKIAYKLLKLKENKVIKSKIIWSIFGKEIENLHISPTAYFGRKTSIKYYIHNPYRILLPIYRMLNRLFSKTDLRRIARKVDGIAHFMDEEIEIYEKILNIKKSHYYFSYYFINKDEMFSVEEKKNSIIVGNSAAYSCNHYDSFNLISRSNVLEKFDYIIVPISYGKRKIIMSIMKVGQSYFKKNFDPLVNWMDFSDYEKLIGSANTMLIYSYRQHALGNILSAIKLGLNVYLSENTSTYRYMLNNGYFIFSIEKLNKCGFFEDLTNDMKLANISKIYCNFGINSIIEKYDNQFEN